MKLNFKNQVILSVALVILGNLLGTVYQSWIYDDYTKANITRDQMAKKTAEVKQKIAEIESLITEKQETLDMQKDLFLDSKQEQLTKLSKLDEFDEEVIRYLIDYVLVYDNEHIEIRWNFDDFQAG